MPLEFRVLGSLEVVRNGRPVPLGGPKERALLALLALRANQLVSRDVLVERLWADRPGGASHALEARMSMLRKRLPDARLVSRSGGYMLEVDPEDVDLLRFEALLADGRNALAEGDVARADELLSAALDCWRGPVLADLAVEQVALAGVDRVEEERRAALEDLAEVRLALGRHHELVVELEAMVVARPLRERSRAQLMLALYRDGRQAEALEVYRQGRRLLVDELGIEPCRELQELQEAILRHDPRLDLPVADATASPPATAHGDAHRKVVTALFCDAADPAASGEPVDPEASRVLLATCFDRMRTIVERYGGTTEEAGGDAAVAVFGIPRLHEDDALRACRAAMELREVFGAVGVQGRIGIESGEVVTGTREALATGAALNVAARLQRAASADEVLVGETTRALVGGRLELEPVPPVPVGRTRRPLSAWRLVRVHDEGERRVELPFVGRREELALLQAAWDRALAGRVCELVTIVGEAGVGKSRLVAEAVARIGVRTVHAHCLPYGDGITYWPVVEVLRQLDALPADPAAAAPLLTLLGESDRATSADEIAWAFRKLLEQEAPLLLIVDDLHCGEENLLNLLEHVALLARDAPILLVGMARPELIEHRPGWPVALSLGPLADSEIAELIAERVPVELRERVTAAAGGNPLFVVELMAMAEHSGAVEVPATLRALLGARLDQLDRPERRVLERAAVEGEVFHRGSIQALAPDEPQLMHRLAVLVARKLIRPDKAQIAGEDGFRFCHLLIRDAAYDALPKAARAELHARFAGWLDDHGRDLVALDELLGYHLERAVRYREELRLPEDEALRRTARHRLCAAGRRAGRSHDHAAAVGLLKRASALLPESQVELDLELDLLDTLWWAGHLDELMNRAAALSGLSAAAGDRVGELCGRLHRQYVQTVRHPERGIEVLEEVVEEALPVFEAAAGDAALCLAHSMRALLLMVRAHYQAAEDAYERALFHAERADSADRFVHWRSICRFGGPTPLSGYLAWQDGLDDRDRREWQLRQDRALAQAMLGHIEEARAQVEALRTDLIDRGDRLALGGVSAETDASIALIAGEPAAAAALAEEGFRMHEQAGFRASLGNYACSVAEACYRLGRLDDADVWAGRGEALGARDDVVVEMPARQVKAKVLARRGEHEAAERLAREAVAIGERTDGLNLQAGAYADLAEVLLLAGRTSDAADAFERALDRYERKENLAMAAHVRQRLQALRECEREPEHSHTCAKVCSWPGR